MSTPGHILVIKLGALGDFIQALGPMKAIRTHHPQAHITLLTTKPFQALAEKSGYFNAIHLDTRPKFYQLSKWCALRTFLNDGQFTRIYDLQNNDRTGFYFKLLKSPKPDWVGVAKGASHRNTSSERTKGLAFHGHVQTLGLAGINNIEIDPMDWLKGNLSGFGLTLPYILIVPGSAPSRPLKRWPHYAALCQKITGDGYQPVLIGTQDEADVTAQIKQACPQSLDLTGKTALFDLPDLARGADACVTNDTGPAHMIAPTGCKTLVLFSDDSNPVRHAPLGPHVKTIQKNDLNDLSPEEVYATLSSFTGGP